MLSCAGQKKGEVLIVEVMCDRSSTMSDEDPSSLNVRLFMIEKEALWYEFEHGVSQQGSSSKGSPWVDVLSARALS